MEICVDSYKMRNILVDSVQVYSTEILAVRCYLPAMNLRLCHRSLSGRSFISEPATSTCNFNIIQLLFPSALGSSSLVHSILQQS